MGLLDIFKKEQKETVKIVWTEHGTTWTELLSWVITEDYNADLQFPQSVAIFDEMRKSDATTIAVLRAIKNPLLSAKWQIQAWWEDDKDIEISDFVKKNLFENVRFKEFLKESLGYLDFGFYYFEKNFHIVDWMIEWKEFAPRIPKAHELWEIQGKEWTNGHPAWVTQQVNSTDENGWRFAKTTYTIPWEKLILFSNDREWNNFEWVSILRNAYKHYFYKDLAYKVSSISSERYGVWIPIAKVKWNTNQASKTKLKELLRNIRSNEQSYWIIGEDVDDLKIMTPDSTGTQSATKDIIDHHDRKIYDAVLAWFLNLSTWDGWSNALSKDQSSFFLRGLQGVADYISETLNDHIKELVDLNYSNVVNYPKLSVSDIGTISMDEQINAIKSLTEAWILDLTIDDKQVLRDIVKLPRLTSEQIDELEKESEESKLEPKKEEKKDEEMEDNKKKDKDLAEKQENPKPTKRENTFTKNITQFEKFLDKKYKEAENTVKDFEKEYQAALIETYEWADTERKDWVVVLKYNTSKVRAWEKKIDEITKRLSKELINSPLQDEIFDEALSKSQETLEQNEKLLSAKARFNSFIDGYVSNMQWVLFNEPRRMKEEIVLHFWSEASKELALESAKATKFNKNILRLSFVTHPRAAYKNIVYESSVDDWFTLFKTVVPSNKVVNVAQRPSWKTFSILYTILTAAAINELANQWTEGKTAEAVSWLWLHHWSFEYYYPIESNKLEEEEVIAKEQRKQLEEEAARINKNK